MKPIEESYDVVVCGGGLAGLSAAVAAAREGCNCVFRVKPAQSVWPAAAVQSGSARPFSRIEWRNNMYNST